MGDRRSLPLLPKSLLITIACLGLALLALGLYLDFTNPAWLSMHPFTNNLLSSVVGFCAVTLIVGVGFTLIGERVSTRRQRERQLYDTEEMVGGALHLASTICPEEPSRSAFYRNTDAAWLEDAAAALTTRDETAIAVVHEVAGRLVRFHADEVVPYADEYLRGVGRVVTPSLMEEMAVLVAAMRQAKASNELAVSVAGYCTCLAKVVSEASRRSARWPRRQRAPLRTQIRWPRRTRLKRLAPASSRRRRFAPAGLRRLRRAGR